MNKEKKRLLFFKAGWSEVKVWLEGKMMTLALDELTFNLESLSKVFPNHGARIQWEIKQLQLISIYKERALGLFNLQSETLL